MGARRQPIMQMIGILFLKGYLHMQFYFSQSFSLKFIDILCIKFHRSV